MHNVPERYILKCAQPLIGSLSTERQLVAELAVACMIELAPALTEQEPWSPRASHRGSRFFRPQNSGTNAPMYQQRGKMNPQKNLHRRSCTLQVSQCAADNDTEAQHSQCSQHRPAMVLLFLKS